MTTIEEVFNFTASSCSDGKATLTLARKAALLGFIDFIVTATPNTES